VSDSIFRDESEIFEPNALGPIALEFVSHPKAPSFQHNDPWVLMNQLVSEISSGSFTANEQLRGLFAEAGLVSLWFYLKFIAGYSGPYGELNDSLHVDMCNFRQQVAVTPGMYAGMVVPRAVFKTTIAGHGASSWELTRNPSLRIGYAGAIAERAARCVSLVANTFEKNEFHQWIYPETRKANRSDEYIILANRPKSATDPNMQHITAGGSVQGIHVDLFVGDDIVGDDMLNSDHMSTADMQRNVNWFKTNHKTLLVSMRRSRVMHIATRYAVDDTSEFVMQDTKTRIGYWEGLPYDWPENGGKWITYYRPCSHPDSVGVERSILPESFTMAELRKMAEDDPWTFHTQYANRPHDTGSAEFSSYHVGGFKLRHDRTEGLILDFGLGLDEKADVVRFKDCDIVSATDPSGGLHGGRKSSRAASVVIAVCPDKRVALVDAEAGFVSTTAYLEWMFKFFRLYKPRNSIIETQGPFKALIPVIRDNERRNDMNIHLRPVDSLGQKEDTIRTILQPLLQRELLFVEDRVRGKLMDELKVFPSRRLDLLDALKIAVHYSITPDAPIQVSSESDDDNDYFEDEVVFRKKLSRRERERISQMSSRTGY